MSIRPNCATAASAETADLVRVRHVGACGTAAANRLGHPGARRVDIRDHDPRALGGETLGAGATDPLRAPVMT